MATVTETHGSALESLPDDELLALIHEHGPRHPATHVLLLRHHRWACRGLAREARRRGLAADLVADVQQEAALAALLAMRAYDAGKLGDGQRCAYRTFLWTVLWARCTDFVRKLRRREAHIDRSADVKEVHDGGGDGVSPFNPRWGGDPARLAEERESVQRLKAALGQMAPASRSLLEEIAAGKSMVQLAVQLALPYHEVKRRRRAALRGLAALLRDWRGDGPAALP
jgi:RNA polymerase sigma factor (sigma-70 family)